MNWKHHIWFSVVFTTIMIFVFNGLLKWLFNYTLFNIYSISFWIRSVPLMIFFGLLPDCDHPDGKITQVFRSIGIIVLLVGISIMGLSSYGVKLNFIFSGFTVIIAGAIILTGTWLLSSRHDHRGLTHSIPFLVISMILLIIGIIDYRLYIVSFFAGFSHHIGDGYPLGKWTKCRKQGCW